MGNYTSVMPEVVELLFTTVFRHHQVQVWILSLGKPRRRQQISIPMDPRHGQLLMAEQA